MPAPIDVAERLDAIAEATLQLASEQGAKAITIRGVAARLGGSTTLVTKYVHSRNELLWNASRYMTAHWEGDRARVLGDLTGGDRLRALVRWSMNTEGFDDAVRRLWIENLASGPDPPTAGSASHEQAHREHDHIGATVSAASDGHEHDWLTDVLFLAFRGYYVSSIEDPDHWPPERAAGAVGRLLDLVESSAPRSEPG